MNWLQMYRRIQYGPHLYYLTICGCVNASSGQSKAVLIKLTLAIGLGACLVCHCSLGISTMYILYELLN